MVDLSTTRTSSPGHVVFLASVLALGFSSLAEPALAQTTQSAHAAKTHATVTDPADDTLAFVETLKTTNPGSTAGQVIDPTVVSSIVPTAIGNFRALGFHADGHRLEGEVDQRIWTLHLTAEEAKKMTQFKLVFLNSIAVMPERSKIEVVLNGSHIGSAAIRSAGGYSDYTFDIPQDRLRMGGNTLNILIDQRHRIHCTVASVYELWTDLDLARSGFKVGNDAPPALERPRSGNLASLIGLPTRDDGSLPVVVHMAQEGQISERSFDQLQELLAQTVLSGGYQRPKVHFSASASVPNSSHIAEGFDVFVGSRDEFRAFLPTLGEGASLSDQIPSVHFAQNSEKPILFLPAGASGLQLANQGPVQGHLARPQVESHSSFSWAQAGRLLRPFNGRRFNSSVTFDMPPDFYAADYSAATLSVNAAFAGGLSQDASLRVHVNDENVASLKLASASPDQLRNKEVELPLRFFQPGENTIELEAVLPAPQDEACDPRQRVNPPMRFALSDATSLSFDRLAKARTLPNLHMTLQSGFPYGERYGNADPVHLAIASPTASALTAAVSTVLHLSQRAGAALPMQTHFGPPSPDMTNALIVSESAALPTSLMSLLPTAVRTTNTGSAKNMLPVDPASADGSWVATAPPTQSQLPQLQVTFAPTASDTESATDAILRTIARGAAAEADNGFSTAIRSLWQSNSPADAPSTRLTIGAQHLSVQQIASPSGKTGAWTIVTAFDDQRLEQGVAGMLDAVNSKKLLGKANIDMLAYNNLDQTVTASVAPSTMRMGAGEFSPGNEVLLLAGWLSRHPFFYAFGLMAMIMVFGALTHVIVKAAGRRDDGTGSLSQGAST
ncbi:MAG: cellulose biosynthesis cyclic di-GMP-binding regulatory protein BcsB [Pseudomonadota bacterium]